MANMILTPDSPYWEAYIKFRLGLLSREDRTKFKSVLFGINYGLYDVSLADEEIAKRRGTLQ